MNPEPLPDIPLVPVVSSNVAAIGYDPETQTARIRFKDGQTYRYAGVPQELHETVMGSESIGKAIRQLRTYPSTKEQR